MYRHEPRATAALVSYAGNSRTHTDEQVRQIGGAIREFGFTNPILIDEENTIIAGHGRLAAAELVGMDEVPCIVLDGLSEAQKKAYVIADNQLALNAAWDDAMLSAQVADLSSEGFDLSLLGFDDATMEELLYEPRQGLSDDDAVPEPPEEALTQPGDVWTLGNHRLMCGDSTSVDAVNKLMGGIDADVVFTSPPYNMQRDYENPIACWDSLMEGVFGAMRVKESAHVLVNLGLAHSHGKVDCYWLQWLDFMESKGLPLFGWYVWDKQKALPGDWNGRLATAHEFIFHFARAGGLQANKSVRKKPRSIIKIKSGTGVRKADGSMSGIASPQSGLNTHKVHDSVFRIHPQMARSNFDHPAMFPVELPEEIYKSFAKSGEVVYEPFSGSGTSIIACEKQGLRCMAMELSPKYVDVAIRRWHEYTGKIPVNEAGDEFPIGCAV